jgi:hypothetical protein
MKDKNDNVVIVYRNKIEIYKLRWKETESDRIRENPDIEWNPFHEISMQKANGFYHVNQREDREI